MSESKIISKETLIPIGLAIAVLAPLVTVIIFGMNVKNIAERNDEAISAHVLADDARVAAMQLQINTLQTNIATINAKLDYLVSGVDELKKGIK